MWSTHTIEYYSSIKRRKSFLYYHMGTEPGEVNQSQRDKYSMIPLTLGI